MSVLRWTDEQLAAHKAKQARKPAKTAPQATPATPKPSKYRNQKTDGYASKKEAKRAAELRALEAAGEICNLREQVKYVLIPKQEGERECSYIADFVYAERDKKFSNPVYWEVVEDCKGMRTDIYRLKRKLMQYVHGIRIRET